MRKTISAVVAVAALIGLNACGRPTLDDQKLSAKELNLEEYFAGRTIAYGQFQDRFGKVRRRFKVEIDGSWDGEVLTLDERFLYADGSRETRLWSLKKTGGISADQSWQGSAEGVRGTAVGQEQGDTFNWRYSFDLPRAEGGTIKVAFDDWMWLQSDGRLLNKAYLRRFGILLGEVTLFFEKQ